MENPKAILIIGVLVSDNVWKNVEEILIRKFGKISHRTEPINFTFTDYYNEEMGDEIKRFWIAFSKLIYENNLADIKNTTITIEKEFSLNGKRMINLDPGYLNLSRLILASTKDFSHRIYLRDGIYGEITLIYRNKTFSILPWTYPDYASDIAVDFFKKVRKLLLM